MIVKRERYLHVFDNWTDLNTAFDKEVEELNEYLPLNPYTVSHINKTLRVGTTVYELAVIKTREDAYKYAGRRYNNIIWHYKPESSVSAYLYTLVRSPK